MFDLFFREFNERRDVLDASFAVGGINNNDSSQSDEDDMDEDDTKSDLTSSIASYLIGYALLRVTRHPATVFDFDLGNSSCKRDRLAQISPLLSAFHATTKDREKILRGDGILMAYSRRSTKAIGIAIEPLNELAADVARRVHKSVNSVEGGVAALTVGALSAIRSAIVVEVVGDASIIDRFAQLPRFAKLQGGDVAKAKYYIGVVLAAILDKFVTHCITDRQRRSHHPDRNAAQRPLRGGGLGTSHATPTGTATQ